MTAGTCVHPRATGSAQATDRSEEGGVQGRWLCRMARCWLPTSGVKVKTEAGRDSNASATACVLEWLSENS